MAYKSQWLKNLDGSWKINTSDIKFSDYLENLKSDAYLNISKSPKDKAIIWVPTHNIHDCFEWFRIFKDSWLITQNFDTYGFWIHGYMDKSKGESIKGWFPNLFEVKAASSEELVYVEENRYSPDFLDVGASYPTLFVDGVQVYDREFVLLKNQWYESVTTYTPDNTITNENTVYIPYVSGIEDFFKQGSVLRAATSIVTWTEHTIANVSQETVLINNVPTQFLRIDIVEPLSDPANVNDVADKNYGTWTKTSQETENGLYQYVNGQLVRHTDIMNDKYKTYNQIVYCYQGLTQENKQFYLRRIEDLMSPNYSFYPNDSMLEPFYYSEGEAYLIKVEVEYELNTADPLHPSAPFNANGDELCYRVMLLDYDIADKIMLTNEDGIGEYEPVTVELGSGVFGSGTPFSDLLFNKYDNSSVNANVIQAYTDDLFSNAPHLNLVKPVFNFRSVELTALTNNYGMTFTSNVTIVQNSNTTSITRPYAGGPFVNKIKTGAIVSGDLVRVSFQFKRDTDLAFHDALDHTFTAQVTTSFTGLSFTLEVFPKLDDNFVNEFNSMAQSPNAYKMTIECINQYGVLTGLYDEDAEVNLLHDAIDKTFLKDTYDISYTYGTTIQGLTDGTITYGSLTGGTFTAGNTITGATSGATATVVTDNGTTTLTYENIVGDFEVGETITDGGVSAVISDEVINNFLTVNKVRQHHKNKWENHGVDIDYGGNNYYFVNVFDAVNSIYSRHKYSLQAYTKDYLEIQDVPGKQFINIAQLQVISATYDNTINNPNRFGMEHNRLIFGSASKEYVLDNLKKHTLIDIVPGTALPSYEVTVLNVYWNEVEQEVWADTDRSFDVAHTPSPTEPVNITTVTDIRKVSRFLNNDHLDGEITYNTLAGGTFTVGNTITGSSSGATGRVTSDDGATSLTFDNGYDKFIVGETISSGPVSAIIASVSSEHLAHRLDSASYAYAFMNYCFDGVSTIPNTRILDNITATMYRENGSPRMSFHKRDKRWSFPNGNITMVVAASTANVNIASAPSTLDTVSLTVGDIIILKNQISFDENYAWIFNGSGQPLIRYYPFDNFMTWEVTGGATNANKLFVAVYTPPLVPGTTSITFAQQTYSLKKDNRLTFNPIQIHKLGVDNMTQPPVDINMKYDSIETEENLLNIQVGINNRHRIRFIDGLTEHNIINNINGQGQYAWILDDNVIVDDAVVGCTQSSGPGTGQLIWYTGTWEEGVWVDGIWIQGTWKTGTWLNGVHNAYPIQDYWYYVIYNPVTDDQLSIWEDGSWIDGTWNGGIAKLIQWTNGTWNDGTLQSGTWMDGTFNGGTINYVVWFDGDFNGGDFETGTWHAGTFDEVDVNIPSRFGTKATSVSQTSRAYWYSGTFKGGEFWSGLNFQNGQPIESADHRGSIWYAGQFQNGSWYGGSFITGVWVTGTWYGGIWFGGYYVTSIVNALVNDKVLTINPAQYDSYFSAGVGPIVANAQHRLAQSGATDFYLLAFPTSNTAFSNDAFANMWEESHNVTTTPYPKKPIVAGYVVTATTIELTISSNTAATTTYLAENQSTGQVKGDPFICAVWKGGTWKGGVWLNGAWENGIFEKGVWAKGLWLNGTFGIDQE